MFIVDAVGAIVVGVNFVDNVVLDAVVVDAVAAEDAIVDLTMLLINRRRSSHSRCVRC